MTYTKKQRQEIYEEAAALVINKNECFACLAVKKAISFKTGIPYRETKVYENNFPEMFLFKNHNTGEAWLTSEDSLTCTSKPQGLILRELVLMFSAEMCK